MVEGLKFGRESAGGEAGRGGIFGPGPECARGRV